MAEKIADLKVSEFLDKLAAPDAECGGGSAVLFGAAMGSCLAAMAAGVTVKRGASEADAELLQKKAVVFKQMAGVFTDMAALDGQAYLDYLEAGKMPQESEEEKKARDEAMQKALVRAVELPMQACDLCVKLLEDIRGIKDKCNKVCLSDLSAAVSLLRDCASGCLMNVIQNSSGLPKPELIMVKVRELSLKIKMLSLDILVNK
ncbi:cyclodeaminase/cyclohydrolase family protein [bacterium]|nr:cyclodeaminase/cyclohydrolase family protein [bacterium]